MFGQCGLYPGWTEQLEMGVVRRHHPLRNESLLAFLTNFVGFLPILLETSEQAQFLVPMTLSLTVGLLVGMTASLILTPVCYAIVGESGPQKDLSGARQPS
jgi:Cu/Ag efflux pump CusA